MEREAPPASAAGTSASPHGPDLAPALAILAPATAAGEARLAPAAHSPGPEAAGDYAHTQAFWFLFNEHHRKTSNLELFQYSSTSIPA